MRSTNYDVKTQNIKWVRKRVKQLLLNKVLEAKLSIKACYGGQTPLT